MRLVNPRPADMYRDLAEKQLLKLDSPAQQKLWLRREERRLVRATIDAGNVLEANAYSSASTKAYMGWLDLHNYVVRLLDGYGDVALEV